MEDELQVKYRGEDHLVLRREQWKGREAQISASDELLEEIKKFHWTLRGSAEHPYLSTKSNGELTYLHTFVLRWLYGDKQFNEMSKEMVIDHLDNDGLNCSFENLCLTSNAWNVAKGQIVDDDGRWTSIPDYIVDAFYLHDQKCYQVQISFNRCMFQFCNQGVATICLKYCNQSTMITDWMYLNSCLKEKQIPNIERLREDCIVAYDFFMNFDNVPKEQMFVEKDGKLYGRRNVEESNFFIICKSVLNPVPWDDLSDEECVYMRRELPNGVEVFDKIKVSE